MPPAFSHRPTRAFLGLDLRLCVFLAGFFALLIHTYSNHRSRRDVKCPPRPHSSSKVMDTWIGKIEEQGIAALCSRTIEMLAEISEAATDVMRRLRYARPELQQTSSRLKTLSDTLDL